MRLGCTMYARSFSLTGVNGIAPVNDLAGESNSLKVKGKEKTKTCTWFTVYRCVLCIMSWSMPCYWCGKVTQMQPTPPTTRGIPVWLATENVKRKANKERLKYATCQTVWLWSTLALLFVSQAAILSNLIGHTITLAAISGQHHDRAYIQSPEPFLSHCV